MSQFKKLQADLRNKSEVKWKHVIHLLRLLLAGVGVLRAGVVPVAVGDHRERVLAITRREIPYNDVEKWRLELHQQSDAAFQSTRLPERPHYPAANDFLLRARREAVTVHP